MKVYSKVLTVASVCVWGVSHMGGIVAEVEEGAANIG